MQALMPMPGLLCVSCRAAPIFTNSSFSKSSITDPIEARSILLIVAVEDASSHSSVTKCLIVSKDRLGWFGHWRTVDEIHQLETSTLA